MIVVAGWPRSGTSLVMQVLDAGGMNVLVSRFARLPRSFNRHGIWEYAGLSNEPARMLASREEEQNVAVKLIHRTLHKALEGGFRPAAVVMTNRPIQSVVASQKALFGDSAPAKELLVDVRAKSREMIAAAEIPLFEINVRKLVDEPAPVVADLAAFLFPFVGLALDEHRMAAVPDPTDIHHP